jgi:hypothetical protein
LPGYGELGKRAGESSQKEEQKSVNMNHGKKITDASLFTKGKPHLGPLNE